MLQLKLQYFGHLMQRTDSLERPWCWERLTVEGAGNDREWDSWMASLMRWTWFWVNSGSWWWTERPGVLQSMGSQRVGHNWVTELNWRSMGLYIQSEGWGTGISGYRIFYKEGNSGEAWLVCLRNSRKTNLARLRTEWKQIRVLRNKPGEVVED